MISKIGELAVVMEFMMPQIEKLGIKFREQGGQTIFHEYLESGDIGSSVFYIGALDADIADETQWTKFSVPIDNVV